jgi:hypothetical protein
VLQKALSQQFSRAVRNPTQRQIAVLENPMHDCSLTSPNCLPRCGESTKTMADNLQEQLYQIIRAPEVASEISNKLAKDFIFAMSVSFFVTGFMFPHFCSMG